MKFFSQVSVIIQNYWKDFMRGLGYTLLISLVSTLIGLVIGLIIGVIRTMPTPKHKVNRVLRKILDFILSAYIEVFRGTPMMVQSMVIYWGYAFMSNGDTLNIIFAGIFIVSINTGAYMAEIVRGGIMSIDKGQFEGAHAIGMSHTKTMLYVILPQVLRNILPSVSNEFVINIKDTSVLNVIGVTELYFFAKVTVKETYKTFQVYFIICVMYFVVTYVITRLLRLLEKKLSGKKNYKIQGSQNMDAESIIMEEKEGFFNV